MIGYGPAGLAAVAVVLNVSAPPRLAGLSPLTKPAYPALKTGSGAPNTFDAALAATVSGAGWTLI